jgi:gamma-glutamyltranspeptidase/glutathione hydrolase
LIAPVRAVALAGAKFTTRPEIIGTFGAVSSTHWLASAVGMSILERGGNAFDAAVATGFTLQIVEPHLSGPAGDMPAILYSARDRAVRVLCAQGVAPPRLIMPHLRRAGVSASRSPKFRCLLFRTRR